jgi:phosphoesterase RecJ-like protein
MEFFEKKRLVRFEMERLVYSGLKFYLNGKAASIYISRKMREETGVREDDIDDFSSIPRQIEGVCAGISVYEQQDGSMKVSLRTTSEIDAAGICRKFGGGGHPRAAGCIINADYETAVKLIVDEISQHI